MKRSAKILTAGRFVLGLQMIGLFCSPVCAAEGPMTHYSVRQESGRSGGVLVSRPNPLDKDMFDFIRVNRIRTLDDYTRWMKSNLVYRKDETFDNWSLPQETLERKAGDCEDFALLTKSVTRVLGYRPQFLALVRENKAHAVCVMKKDGYYVWFDNARFVPTPARTFDEFSRYMTTNFQYNEINELNEETGEWIPRYQKPAQSS